MIKKFYGFAWVLLMGSALASVFTGSLNEWGMFAFSLIALGLVYALALWLVLANTRNALPE